MPDLSGPQLNRLSDAITQVLPREVFNRVLKDLDKNYEAMAREGATYARNVEGIVYQSSDEGWVIELLRLVSDTRPNSQMLAELRNEIIPPKDPTGKHATLPGAELHNNDEIFFLSDGDESLYGNQENLSHGSVGSIHLHLDGPRQEQSLFLNFVEQYKKEKLLSEINRVDRDMAAAQRRAPNWEGVYDSHTPNALGFFTTTRLHDGPKRPTAEQWERIRSVTGDMLTTLHHQKKQGMVVELERVVAMVDFDGNPTVSDDTAFPYEYLRTHLLRDSLLFKPTSQVQDDGYLTMYELHFSINIRKGQGAGESDTLPFTLEQLCVS
jgi:hypothetical protein